MQYFVLGLAAVTMLLVMMRLFATANPSVAAQRVRKVGGAFAIVAALAMIARGLIVYALPLAILAMWLFNGGAARGWGGSGGGETRGGRTSRVETEHLEMELDLDSGAMRGRVLKGFFAGRDIESLKPVEMALLWQDCRFSDPQSAQLLEAYLDRVHPTWREGYGPLRSRKRPWTGRLDDASAGL